MNLKNNAEQSNPSDILQNTSLMIESAMQGEKYKTKYEQVGEGSNFQVFDVTGANFIPNKLEEKRVVVKCLRPHWKSVSSTLLMNGVSYSLDTLNRFGFSEFIPLTVVDKNNPFIIYQELIPGTLEPLSLRLLNTHPYLLDDAKQISNAMDVLYKNTECALDAFSGEEFLRLFGNEFSIFFENGSGILEKVRRPFMNLPRFQDRVRDKTIKQLNLDRYVTPSDLGVEFKNIVYSHELNRILIPDISVVRSSYIFRSVYHVMQQYLLEKIIYTIEN